MRLDQLRLLFDAGNLMAAEIVPAPLEGSACVFQTKVATDSRRSLPPIPRESCH
jgi:hypothetical protein